MPDTADWVRALRSSHEHFAAAVAPLDEDAVTAPSYASEWSIAQTASHLGSQAEIFSMFLEAGLTGSSPPGSEAFGPIWDSWNNRPAAQQVADSVSANDAFVTRLEQLPDAERNAFRLSMFGMELDLSGLAAMRLGEHALHTWDVVVALEPAALLAAEVVALLVDTVPATAERIGKPLDSGETFAIETVSPRRDYLLTTGPVVKLSIEPQAGPAALRLPAEAFIRLLFGRLDPDHTPPGVEHEELLRQLRVVFPGF